MTNKPRKRANAPRAKATDGPKRTSEDRGQAFIHAYLSNGHNATQAAISAGYSAKTAQQKGSNLLHRPDILERLNAERKRLAEDNKLTIKRIADRLEAIAFGDPRDLMVWGPGGVILKDSADLTPQQAAMVAEVAETETKLGTNLKLKRHDQVKALELLGKMLGMFIDKTENKTTLLDPDGNPTLPTVRVVFVNPSKETPNVPT
jgi:phage terminase small subunit